MRRGLAAMLHVAIARVALCGCSGAAPSDPPRGGDAGPPISRCALELGQDGTLDIDIPTVRIRGRVTLNGAPAPRPGPDGPELRLVGPDGVDAGRLVALADVGGADFDVRVVPDRYRLVYSHPGCSDARYPCQRDVDRGELVLTADGSLVIDLSTVRVSGQVRYAGGALPAAATRGQVSVHGSAGSHGELVDLDELGADGRFVAELFAGSYELRYDNFDPGCTGTPYPCQQDVPLVRDVRVTAPGTLDVELLPSRVSGRVRLTGADLPAPPAGARLALRAANDGPARGQLVRLADLGADGRYDVRVFPGAYELRYDNPDPGCTGTPYPCQQDVPILALTVPAGAASLDVDLRPVRVSGRVTLDGAPPPAAGDARVEIRLRGADGSRGRLVDLDARPGGAYDAWLFPGRATLLYENNDVTCTGEPWPCQWDTAIREVTIAAGVLDVDLDTVAVSGQVSYSGGALPPAGYTRGRIALVAGDADDAADRGASRGVYLWLDDVAAAGGRYRVRVLRGRYHLDYDNPDPTCTGVPYPCQSGARLVALDAVGDGARDLDLAPLRLAGRVTLDGAALPAAAYARGALALRAATDGRGTLVWLDDAPAGDYQVRVFPGRYDVVYEQHDATCVGAPYPCQVAVLSCHLSR